MNRMMKRIRTIAGAAALAACATAPAGAGPAAPSGHTDAEHLLPETTHAAADIIARVDDSGKIPQEAGKHAFAGNACGSSWTKTKTETVKNRRVILHLNYTQTSGNGDNVTTLEASVAVKKRVLFFWVHTTADEIRLRGEFAGPRSPRDLNGNYGYVHPNPFDVNYSAPITHFTDHSLPSLDCFTMSRATYTATARFPNATATATIQW